MQNPKDQSSMDARQARLGFIISVTTFILMLVAEIAFLATGPGPITSLLDVRVVTIAIVISSLVSAWLARREKTVLGLTLILLSLYLAVLSVVFTVSGVGAASGAVTLVLTFGMTSALFPPRASRWMNIIAMVITLVSIGLDVFDLFPRAPSEQSSIAWIIAIFLLAVYGILVYRQFPTYSLRTKFIIVMSGTTFIALVVLAFVGVTVNTRSLTQNVGQRLAGDADSHGYQIGDLLDGQVNTLRAFSLNGLVQQAVTVHVATYASSDQAAILSEIEQRDRQWVAAGDNDPIIQTYLTNAVAQDLQEFTRTFADHREVFVTDIYGALVAASQRTSDYYQADEDWWQATYADGKGAVYISSTPEKDESVGEYSMLMAVPLLDRNTGDLIGIMRSTYIVRALDAILATTTIGETGDAELIFTAGTPAHFDEGDVKDIEPQNWQALSAVLDQPYTQMFYDGVDRFIGISPVRTVGGDSAVDSLGWLVILYQDQKEALAPVQQQTNGTTVIAVIIIVLASGAAIGLAQLLVVPISRLTAVAEKVSAGDFAVRAEVPSEDEIGRLATSFNAMTSQLQSTLQGLEQRVADRTRALETATEVSRRISTILDQHQLVSEVVEQVRSSFDYYHTHIYLFDEQKENLLMAGGTGEAGQIMLENGHAVSRGRGLVGRAASTNLPVLVPDVTKVDGWLPNPLLPETRSEAAVPIAIGENILGVLDVQDDAVNGLNEADIALLQAIAGQVAIALQNARAYQQAQRQADREALIGNIAQQIQSTTTMEDALKVAAREVGRALGTTVGIQLKRPADGAKN